MADQDVLLQVKDYVATITLNRPEARNAITIGMVVQITKWFDDLKDRDDVRVVVLRGAGGQAFCAGHDLKELSVDAVTHSQNDYFGELCAKMVAWPKPTIAATQGYVRAAGMWLSTSCDIVMAADNATFGWPQILFGSWVAYAMVPAMRRIGRGKVVELMLTADVIDAQEAKQIGLVDRLVPVEGFEDAVQELAGKIASRDPQAVRAGKEALALLIDLDTSREVKQALLSTLLRYYSRKGEELSGSIMTHLATIKGSGHRQLKK